MKFQDAVEQMRTGAMVRRAAWPATHKSVSLDNEANPGFAMTHHGMGNSPDTNAPWKAEGDDLKADDWSVVGKKPSGGPVLSVYEQQIAAGRSPEEAMQADRAARGLVRAAPAVSQQTPATAQQQAPGGGLVAPAQPAPQPGSPGASNPATPPAKPA